MARSSSASGVFVAALATILVAIIVWSSVGIIVETSGIVIYPEFPSKPTFMGTPVPISINNNAPLTVPFFSPTYAVQVSVLSNASEIKCEYAGAREELPCGATVIDLGRIAPGESKGTAVTIQTRGNFTLQIAVYMSFFTSFQVKTRTISCRVSSADSYSLMYYACSEQ